MYSTDSLNSHKPMGLPHILQQEDSTISDNLGLTRMDHGTPKKIAMLKKFFENVAMLKNSNSMDDVDFSQDVLNNLIQKLQENPETLSKEDEELIECFNNKCEIYKEMNRLEEGKKVLRDRLDRVNPTNNIGTRVQNSGLNINNKTLLRSAISSFKGEEGAVKLSERETDDVIQSLTQESQQHGENERQIYIILIEMLNNMRSSERIQRQVESNSRIMNRLLSAAKIESSGFNTMIVRIVSGVIGLTAGIAGIGFAVNAARTTLLPARRLNNANENVAEAKKILDKATAQATAESAKIGRTTSALDARVQKGGLNPNWERQTRGKIATEAHEAAVKPTYATTIVESTQKTAATAKSAVDEAAISAQKQMSTSMAIPPLANGITTIGTLIHERNANNDQADGTRYNAFADANATAQNNSDQLLRNSEEDIGKVLRSVEDTQRSRHESNRVILS